MVVRRPLVVQNGFVDELLQSDSLSTAGGGANVIAGSGLTSVALSSTETRYDIQLAPNPSGVIYVGNALGLDGAAGVIADTALASGSAAAALASNALASGNDALVIAPAALASGNAALEVVSTLGGGGGTVVELIAASAVVSGYTVGIDDTGKVQTVAADITDNSNPITFTGSPSTFELADTQYISSTYDSTNNRTVIAYSDAGNSYYGTTRVGTILGDLLAVGPNVVVFNSGFVSITSCVHDSSNNRIVISYRDEAAGGNGNSIVGTISTSPSNNISFGTEVNFAGNANHISSVYDPSSNQVIVSYADGLNSSYGTARVGAVSGTSISFGTATVFESAQCNVTSLTYDSVNNKSVIAYSDFGNSTYGTAVVGTVSGTSISFGSPVVFESAATSYISAVCSSTSNRIVIAYRDDGNSNYGTAVVGTVSGTSISFGTAVIFESANSAYISISYDSISNRVVIAYTDSGNSAYGTAIVGAISGSSISFNTPAVFESANSDYFSTSFNSTNNRIVIAYRDVANSNYGTSIVADSLFLYSYNPTVNSYPNVLGISQSTVASGSPCLVNLPGTLYNEPAANLTPGAFYYANPTTSGITTTSAKPASWDGQVPWNYIGRAVTSSGLMLLKSI